MKNRPQRPAAKTAAAAPAKKPGSLTALALGFTAAAVLIGFLIYSQSLNGPFLFDDTSLLFALRKFHNRPGPLSTHATATLARNPGGRWRVAHIQAELRLAEAAADHAQLERLLAQFEDFCIVTESVRQGVPVTVAVSDAQGQRLHGPGAAERVAG